MSSVTRDQIEKLRVKYKSLISDKNEYELRRAKIVDKIEDKKKRKEEIDNELSELGINYENLEDEINKLFKSIGTSLMEFSEELQKGSEKLDLIEQTLKDNNTSSSE